jgi:septal ring factor EnvC (AmiA/AmiB activator)
MIFRSMMQKLAILTFFFLLTFTGPAQQKDTSVKSTESQLQQIQEQIKQAKQKEELTKKQEKSVMSQLAGIEQRINQQSRQLNTLESKLTKNLTETEILQKELITAQSQLNLNQVYLALRLRSLYQTKRIRPFRQFLASNNYSQQIRHYQYQEILAYQENSNIPPSKSPGRSSNSGK